MASHYILFVFIFAVSSSALPADSKIPKADVAARQPVQMNSVTEITRSGPRECISVTGRPVAEFEGSVKVDYGRSIIRPGINGFFLEMRCDGPPIVSKSFFEVCDFASIPLTSTVLFDDSLRITVHRRDPAGLFLGNAEVTAYIYCGYRIDPPINNAVNN